MKVSQIFKQVAKRGVVLALVVLMLASCCFSTSAAAFVPYTTYTYDFDGNDLKSPHAYVAEECLTSIDMGMGTALANPSDIFIGPDGNIYVADTGNSRIVFFDAEMKYRGELASFYNEGAIIPYVQDLLLQEMGDPDKEPAPEGESTSTGDPLAGGSSAIVSVEEAMEALQKKLTRKLESYAEPDEGEEPQYFELSLEQYFDIEVRLASTPEGDREAEYAVIVSELTAAGNEKLPTYEVMDVLLNYVTPVLYAYDSIEQSFVDEQTLGKTDDERRCAAYFNLHLISTENDPSAGKFFEPEGVFVTADNTLFVADTGNNQVVKLEHVPGTDGKWKASNYIAKDTFKKPDSSVLDSEFVFKPANLVVDTAGRMYVNVKNVNSGIMQLNAEGEFMGYYGAQKVTGSVMQWFMQLFQSDEQRARTVRVVPRVYNNIAIDSKNFVWITANSMENFDLFSYLTSGDSSTAPIKRLNPSGDDVLVRNGIWAPGGDIPFDTNDVSSIVDVAVKGDTGIYTLVDDKRNKLFTYDSDGNLLYAFGGTGSQLGVFQLITAAVYQGTDLLVLDKTAGSVTRFKQTEYATMIETALTADDNREYEKAEQAWKQVQKLNANFDLAYIGLAKSYLRNAAQAKDTEVAKELYQNAMEYYKLARNTEGYSKAFKEYRSLYVRDNLWLILLVPVVLLVALYFAFRAVNKVNAKLHVTGTATTLKEELCYGWRAIFHPISGFWEIKREKRGSMRAAFIFLGLAVLAFCFQATGTAYLFNNVAVEEISIIQQAANVLIPVVLWVLASWSFTTLMSGEGSMKDIFIALCYGLIPLFLILVPVTLVTNICSLDEQPFITFFQSLAYVWMGLLVVFGSMVVQDYTFGKNLLTVILSVLGMAAIMFIVLLLFSLTGKMFGFLETIYQEVAYRL